MNTFKGNRCSLTASFTPLEHEMGFAHVQASSAHGIELVEDLLWDLASLSFVPHVFQPTLTFFPASGGEGSNGNRDKDGVGGGTRDFTETSEASICAQLVSAVAPSPHKMKVWLSIRETAYVSHLWEPLFLFRCFFLASIQPRCPRGCAGSNPVSVQQIWPESEISEGGGRHASNVFESGDVEFTFPEG